MRKTEETDWKQFTKDFFLHQEDDIHDLLARQKNDDEALAEEDALFKVEDRDGAQKFTILDAWKSNESNFDFQDIEEGKPMEETNKLIGQEKRKMVRELNDEDYKINEGIIDTLFPALATKEEVMNDPNITPEDREMMIRFWENEEIDAQNPDMFDDAYNWVKGKLGKESKASESEKLECPNCKNKGGLFESTFAKNGYLCEYCDADITDEAIADWNDVDWLDLDNLLDTKESKASEDYLVTVRNKNDDWNSLDDTWVNTAEDARKVKSEKESQYSNNSNVVVRIANYNTHTNYGKNDGYESKAKEGGYGSGKNRHGFGHKKWMKNAEINDSIIDNPFTKEYDKLLRSNSEMDYND